MRLEDFNTEDTKNHEGARRLHPAAMLTDHAEGRAERIVFLLRAPSWFSVSSVVRPFASHQPGLSEGHSGIVGTDETLVPAVTVERDAENTKPAGPVPETRLVLETADRGPGVIFSRIQANILS